MELAYIFLSVLLGLTAAVPQDMSGKMLIFPVESDTAHVRLHTSRQNLGAATACLRYFTDLTRPTTFFSLSTPSNDNGFLIDKTNDFLVTVRNTEKAFKGVDFKTNRWQSVCATWDSESGLTQLWLDGKPSTYKISSTSSINEPMIILLGQEQDRYGGGFDVKQSFVGMISDVHMWDHVLSPCSIAKYNQRQAVKGNVLNWDSIEMEISGKVLVKEENPCGPQRSSLV